MAQQNIPGGFLYGSFVRFIPDRRGAAAVIFSAALLPVMVAIGAAVDFSRRSDVQSALQRAVDAAALSAAITVKEGRSNANGAALETFAATFGRATDVSDSKATYQFVDGVHRVVAEAQVPTHLMAMVGFKSMKIAAQADAIYQAASKAEPAEIAIVFDNTNSMTFGNLWSEAIKAVTTMLEAIKGDCEEDYYVTLIPMSDRVNVSSIKNSSTSWMKAKVPNNWNGCLEPRENPITGFNYALDDEKPTSSKFDPSAPGYFIPNHVGATYGNNGVPYCPKQSITGPTSDIKAIEKALGEITPGGTGRPDEGMAWGWRALSEKWQGQWKVGDGYPAKHGKRRKMVIFVSDGRNTAYDFEVGGKAGGSFGYNMGSKLGFEHLVQVCSRMKAQGIEIHMVQAEGNPNFDTYAKQCASKPETYYRFSDVKSFKTAFEKIASKSGSEVLRLVR